MPLHLVDAMDLWSPYLEIDKERYVARVPLKPYGRMTFREALFPARSRNRLRLLVHIPEELREKEYEVFVRQLFKEEEVGRVTWRLVPEVRKELPYQKG
jgi:hypothetical protein